MTRSYRRGACGAALAAREPGPSTGWSGPKIDVCDASLGAGLSQQEPCSFNHLIFVLVSLMCVYPLVFPSPGCRLCRHTLHLGFGGCWMLRMEVAVAAAVRCGAQAGSAPFSDSVSHVESSDSGRMPRGKSRRRNQKAEQVMQVVQ